MAQNAKNDAQLSLMKGLQRNRSEHDFLDPKKKGQGRVDLDKYMAKRSALLTKRYGEGGQGYFYARELPRKRQVPFIESLLPPESKPREASFEKNFVPIWVKEKQQIRKVRKKQK